MNPIDLNAIEARVAAATEHRPLPWSLDSNSDDGGSIRDKRGFYVADTATETLDPFILNAPADIVALVAHIRKQAFEYVTLFNESQDLHDRLKEMEKERDAAVNERNKYAAVLDKTLKGSQQ